VAKKLSVQLEDLEAGKLDALLQRIQPLIQPEDFHLLQKIISTICLLFEWIQRKNLTLRRLRRMIFCSGTEKTSSLLPRDDGPKTGADKPQQKPKGHGRNGVQKYPGARRIVVPHETLQPGCNCPDCVKGRLYQMSEPATMIRIVAEPIFPATLYELMRLRCNSCLAIFTAKAPPEAGETKYSEEVPSMLAVLRYGSGLPLFRIEKLQRPFGVPMPVGTQWELLRDAAKLMMPVFEALVHFAAQACLFFHDDTRMKVLSLMKENSSRAENGGKERTGMFTTGILAQAGEHRIVLFFTGRKHAGENLEKVLEQRSAELPAPIQMCDGASSNRVQEGKMVEANCAAHSRRKFVEVLESFPEESRFVIESFREVYRNDAEARELGLCAEERLRFHQERSLETMDALERWAREQIEQKKVEPNSGLGEAISYMLKRWDKLTLFLRKAGAPVDNNAAELILKRAILHRKNSLFYRNERGSAVGDLYMSLIETCRLCGADPFEYLTILQKHSRQVAERPEEWLPWNYRLALAAADTS
jgi:transposase